MIDVTPENNPRLYWQMKDRGECFECGALNSTSAFTIRCHICRELHDKNQGKRPCPFCGKLCTGEDSCMACRKMQAKTPLKELRAIVDEIKNAPCMDCNQYFIPAAMDFDHRDKTTKIAAVSQMVIKHEHINRIKEEIAKCDLVCANCHRIRTHNRSRNS